MSSWRSRVWVSAALLLFATGAIAGEAAGDAGESKEALALKNRSKAPTAMDIDAAASIDALLAKAGAADWAQAKGAHLQAYVVQVEKEADGDVHVVLANSAAEPDTHKWLIVETTPAWAKKNSQLSAAKLRGLVGKKVDVTGWLYYEPDAEQNDPRGTRWEIHPVTQISVLP